MAGSRTYRTKVLVLDKTKLKETDLILTMLDERGRQVRAVAKGARKPGGRLAARCELFCTVDMLLAHGRSLDVVSQAELMEAPLGAAPDYETTCAASAIAEVARACSFEDAEDPFTFAITQRALTLVGSGLDSAHMDLLVAAFVFKLLSHVGYRPDFSACVLCGDPMLSYFSAQAGGLLCGSCASSVPGAELVSVGEVAWLRALMSMTFDALMDERIDPHTALFCWGFRMFGLRRTPISGSVRWNSCWVGDDAQVCAACGNIPTCWYLDLGCSLHPAASQSEANRVAAGDRETKGETMTVSKERKAELTAQFGNSPVDTGNPKVQVAILSERIKELTEHMKSHQKDFHTRRGLLMLVGRRRRLLSYIKKNDIVEYRELIKALGIRDNIQ